MRTLFRVEAEAKIRGIVGTDAHLVLRLEKSKAVLDAIFEWITETRPKVLPKSPLGAAMGYMEKQRPRLERFLSDPKVPLHNNESEARLADHRAAPEELAVLRQPARRQALGRAAIAGRRGDRKRTAARPRT